MIDNQTERLTDAIEVHLGIFFCPFSKLILFRKPVRISSFFLSIESSFLSVMHGMADIGGIGQDWDLITTELYM